MFGLVVFGFGSAARSEALIEAGQFSPEDCVLSGESVIGPVRNAVSIRGVVSYIPYFAVRGRSFLNLLGFADFLFRTNFLPAGGGERGDYLRRSGKHSMQYPLRHLPHAVCPFHVMLRFRIEPECADYLEKL